MNKDQQIKELKETIDKAQKQIEDLQKPEFKVGDKVRIIGSEGHSMKIGSIGVVGGVPSWKKYVVLVSNGLYSQEIYIKDLEHYTPWKPEKGEKYYIPSPVSSDYYDRYIWYGYHFSSQLFKRGLVFKTEEEAIECSKKMIAAIGGEV